MTEKKQFDFGKEIDEDYLGVGGETGAETTSTLARDSYLSGDDTPSEEDRLCREVGEAAGERCGGVESVDEVEELLSAKREAYHDDGGGLDATEAPDETHRFDTSHGNGSGNRLDDVIDENAIIEHDGRANTNTFFYVWEAPDGRRSQFSRMLRWNEGEGSSDRSINNRQADRNRYVDTFCGKLDMHSYHKDRVKHICQSVDMSRMGPRSSQETVLAIVTIVANEDNRFVRDEKAFRDLVEDIDSSLDTIKKLRKLLHKKSSEL